MSQTANLSIATANAQATAFSPLLNSGFIAYYTGAQPATADTALSGNTLLVTFPMSATAWSGPVNGVLTANAITGANAVASGTVTFARFYASNGTTAVMDCQVGISGAGINVSTTALTDGAAQTISSLTYSPAAGMGS